MDNSIENHKKQINSDADSLADKLFSELVVGEKLRNIDEIIFYAKDKIDELDIIDEEFKELVEKKFKNKLKDIPINENSKKINNNFTREL